MPLPFVRQYPNGRRCLAEVTPLPEAERLGQAFIANGGAYVCEILPGGKARIAACMLIDDKQVDVAEEVCENGPELMAAVDRLVRASAWWSSAYHTLPCCD